MIKSLAAALLFAAVLSGPLWAETAPTKESPALGQGAGEVDDMKMSIAAMKARLADQERRLVEMEAQQAQDTAYGKIIDDLRADAAKRPAMPGWLENLKFAGDFRLRYDGRFFDWNRADDSGKKDRHQARFRLRFGFVKSWFDEELQIGFRLASGSNNDPTSTNQTFTDNFSKKPVWIDQAWAKYSPKAVKGLSVTGGKFATPWATNEIFMDSDVNPEGFWAEYKAPKLGIIEPFAGAGYFIARESEEAFDTTLAVYQAGVRAQFTDDVKYTFATNLQDWDQFEFSGATPRGNDSPLSEIPNLKIINLTNNLDVAKVFGKPVNVFADFAHNCDEADPNAKYQDANNAFATGAKWGQNKKKGDWSMKYRYAFVEANALPGHFVDADFGFANRQGHVAGGEYNLADNLTVGASVFLTQPIFTPTTTAGSRDEDMTATVMADLVWKF